MREPGCQGIQNGDPYVLMKFFAPYELYAICFPCANQYAKGHEWREPDHK